MARGQNSLLSLLVRAVLLGGTTIWVWVFHMEIVPERQQPRLSWPRCVAGMLLVGVLVLAVLAMGDSSDEEEMTRAILQAQERAKRHRI